VLPGHRTLFMATDLNPRANLATQGTGAANGVSVLALFSPKNIPKTAKRCQVEVLEVICTDLVGCLHERLQVRESVCALACRLGSEIDGNMFRTGGKGAIDVLLFNPPYVPTPSDEVGGR
jgi:hypothetical protein